MNKFYLWTLVFILSFSVRYWVTSVSRENDTWIDLLIYTHGGQLVSNKVNPYDPWDNMALRDSLRTSTLSFSGWLAETQDRWNYYASGNLPFTLLLYGAIDLVAHGDPYTYRLVFCALDSMLAIFIFEFIFSYWNTSTYHKYILSILLGILCPVMLYFGAFYPEDKGLQILLMIGALHFSKQKKFLAASVFLGLSVAFKGIGIFIAPLCLYYMQGEPKTLLQWRSTDIQNALLFTGSVLSFTALCFIFYLPDVLGMIDSRLDNGMNMEVPIHGSMWRFIYLWTGESWQMIKTLTTIIFILINVALILRKKMTFEIFSASLLVWFVGITLVAGSIDRMNMAFITIILLLGASDFKSGLVMSGFYISGGFILYFSGMATLHRWGVTDFEILDAAFALLFFFLYLLVLIDLLFRRKSQDQQSFEML